jgi:glucose-6-phosphate-specific signal transduction histidine kinase
MTTPGQRSARLFWTLQLGGWLAFGVAMALSRVSRYPLDYMVATKGALAALGLVVSLGLRVIYRRHLPETSSLRRITLLTVATSYAAALLWTAGYNLVDARLATALLGRPVAIESLAQLTGGAVYHAFALLAWSVFYVAVHRHLALEAERVRASRAEALAHEARLRALRYQLQPHFLFNALNALSTLIVEQRTAEASRMVSRLADFLRLTLDGTDAEEVTLAEELEFARRYLDIEQVRFGARLRVHIDVRDDARPARVPSLVLQPLVENAIRHGVAPRKAGGAVTIEAHRDGDVLRLSVTNDGSALGAAGVAPPHEAPSVIPTENSNGIGLANTRARLAELYGSAHRIELCPLAEGRGPRVEMAIPYREGVG